MRRDERDRREATLRGIPSATSPGCELARERIHRALDGESDRSGDDELDVHLAGCAACREFREDLFDIQAGLRGLPGLELPPAALARVWERTVRGERSSRRPWRFAGPAAAAALLTLALVGLGQGTGPARLGPAVDVAAHAASPTPAEVARAAEETRLVLDLMASALNEAERTTGRILQEKVTPALERVPVVGGAARREGRSNRS